MDIGWPNTEGHTVGLSMSINVGTLPRNWEKRKSEKERLAKPSIQGRNAMKMKFLRRFEDDGGTIQSDAFQRLQGEGSKPCC